MNVLSVRVGEFALILGVRLMQEVGGVAEMLSTGYNHLPVGDQDGM